MQANYLLENAASQFRLTGNVDKRNNARNKQKAAVAIIWAGFGGLVMWWQSFGWSNRGPKHIQYFLDDKLAARVHRMAVWVPQLEGINNSLPQRLFKL